MSTSPWHRYVVAFFTPVAVGVGITWALMRDGDRDLSEFKQQQPETLKLYHENNTKIMKHIIDSTKGDKIVYFAEKEEETITPTPPATQQSVSQEGEGGFFNKWFGWGSSATTPSTTSSPSQDHKGKPLKQSDKSVSLSPSMVPSKQQANQQQQQDRIKQLQEETKKKQLLQQQQQQQK